MPNLVSFLVPVPKYWATVRQDLFAISGIPFKTLTNKNCHNLRYNGEIDVKLWPICKIVKRNTTTWTKFRQWHLVGKLWRHCHFPNFCPICRNARSRIPDRWYMLYKFWLIFLVNNNNVSKTRVVMVLMWHHGTNFSHHVFWVSHLVLQLWPIAYSLHGFDLSRSFKTAIYGTFVRSMRKSVRYCFDKNHDERAWCRN